MSAKEWLDYFSLAIAGAIGAVVSLPFHPDQKGFGNRTFLVGCGAAFAHFLAPLTVEYLHVDQAHTGSVGFLVGLFGMSFASAIMRAISQSDLWGLVKARLGG